MSPAIWVLQDPPVLSFSPKRIAERLTYGFDFINLLNSGETIASGFWYVSAVRPLDAPTPIQMLFGSSNIKGTQIFQMIQSGTEGVLYNVVAQISTSFGNVMEQNAILLCTNDAFE